MDLKLPETASVYRVTREVIEAVSPMKTPQNVVFSVGIRESSGEKGVKGSIILENIQDPGNIGTVIRTANAFGVRRVILTGACADPWGPKAVRASMGAIFRQDIREMSLDELADAAAETPIYGAALSDTAEDIRRVELSDCAVAIGSEGRGLTGDLLDICAGRIIIPMRPESESLNAAAAASIIMWEMCRNGL